MFQLLAHPRISIGRLDGLRGFACKLTCLAVLLLCLQLLASPLIFDSSQVHAQDWSFGDTSADGVPPAPGCGGDAGEKTCNEFEWNNEKPGVLSCRMGVFMNGRMGLLLTGLAGIGAVLAAAMGAYRASWTLVIVACSSFSIQTFVSLFYPLWAAECEIKSWEFFEKIEQAYCYLIIFLEGPLGSTVASAAGVGAILASVAGASRAAWGFLYFCAAAFVLSSLISMFFALGDTGAGNTVMTCKKVVGSEWYQGMQDAAQNAGNNNDGNSNSGNSGSYNPNNSPNGKDNNVIQNFGNNGFIILNPPLAPTL